MRNIKSCKKNHQFFFLFI